MNEDNKIFKTNEISIEISPVKNTVDSQRAQYYSYDENSGLQRIHILKDGQPLGLPEGSEIRLSAVKLSGTKQMMVYTPEIEDRVKGIVTFVIPKEFLGYSGQIRCTLYIDFSSDQTLHAGYFYINMGISDIDANLPEFSDSYWQRWADFESEATVKMKELEAALDVEAQLLTDHANQKITEYDQKFQQTEQNIATLDQNFTELRENMKLSEAWAWSKDGRDRFTRVYPKENLLPYTKLDTARGWNGGTWIDERAIEVVKSVVTTNRVMITASAENRSELDLTKFYSAQAEIWVSEDAVLTGATSLFIRVFTLTGGMADLSASTIPSNIARGQWVRITTVPAKPPSDTDVSRLFEFSLGISTTATGTFRFRKPKLAALEKETDRDLIYTPHPSDDKQNAYPQYRGLALLPSDLPYDYVWEESAERIKQLAQQETDKLKGEVADIQNWIRQQGGTI